MVIDQLIRPLYWEEGSCSVTKYQAKNGVGGDKMRRGGGGRDKNDVFVGNIPYGTTEEQLHQIFSEAGRVVNIRLVSDHETGKPRGYAFVEYEDASTALSSIRNLNGYECNGRQLRVNFSNNSSLGAEQQRGDKSHPQERTIKIVVSAMGIHEVYDVVSNMKQLVEKEPEKAKQMLVSHPQVAEALLHMQVRLGMLKAEDVPSLQGAPSPPLAAPPVVGGAIMLGKGAQLPILVPPQTPAPPPPFPPPAPPAPPVAPTSYPSQFQPPPQPPQSMSEQGGMWGDALQSQASSTSTSQGQFLQHQSATQQQDFPPAQQPMTLQPQPQQAPPPPPPPPPPILKQPPQGHWTGHTSEVRSERRSMVQQNMDIDRPLQHQQPGYQTASADPREPRDPREPGDPRKARAPRESREPRDPRNRYNRS